MIEIFHYPLTRSMRLIWLCEELGLEYEVHKVDFSAEYRNSAEWRALSPTGKVPVLRDGDVTIFESGAMLEFLLERYGEGRLKPPAGTKESALYLQWCWFAEATLARPLGDIVHHTVLKPEAERIPEVVVDATERARTCIDALEQTLATHRYLLGDEFTAADIMVGYSLLLAQRMNVLSADDVQVHRYFELLRERPGYEVATT